MAHPRLISLVALLAACSTSLPTPTIGPHPRGQTPFVEVEFPPPPGQVEAIPPKPTDGAVWIDGEWAWDGRRWIWQTGGWVVPPVGAAWFAPWQSVRRGDGKLFYTPGSWHDATGRELPKPPLVLPASTGVPEPAKGG